MKISFPAIMALSLLVSIQTAQTAAQTNAQYRAFWVDTFNTALNNHHDILSVINNVRLAKCNAVIVQVRRRGDSWYLNSLEPLADRTPIESGFDPLADLISEAHANDIEVHAFVIIGALWNGNPTSRPPESPNHAFNKHGFNQATGRIYEGRDNWLTRTLLADDGAITFGGYRIGNEFWIDLGHPDAAEHTLSVLMHLVRNYDIDGLHLDRIRYPELSVSGQTPSTGVSIGYNETSVARFQRRYGVTTGSPPAQNDPRWNQWRRDQVTNFVRRVYLSALTVKPHLIISAALIAFGAGPVSEADWNNAECYWRVYQDWRAWTEEGIIDYAIPMDYKRDHQASQASAFDSWMEWTKNHQYDRAGLIGTGAYLNSIEGTLRQARRTFAPSNQGKRVNGVVFFSLANTNDVVMSNPLSIPAGQNTPRRSFAEFASGLTTGKSSDGAQAYEDSSANPVAVFAQTAPVPAAQWKTSPQVGHLMGIVRGRNGEKVDTGEIRIDRVNEGAAPIIGRTNLTTATDGSGFYGGVDLAPGKYRVTVTPVGEGAFTPVCAVTIIAGLVSSFDIVVDRGGNTVASVSAASYCGPVIAQESISAAFGASLAPSVQMADSVPLPTVLAGTSVMFKDSSGVERPAPLFFVSPGQVNYQVPPGIATGLASVTISKNDNSSFAGTALIARVAPGLFAANVDGRGVAAAVVLRIKADGTQVYEPVAQLDMVTNRFVTRPIDLGPETDQVFLVLYGTGVRFGGALSGVSLRIGGLSAEVLFIGESPGFVGLDQINARLPRSLIGRGDVDVVLIVDGYPANTVQVNIRGQ